MLEIKDDEINVDELMLRIRQEAERRKALNASPSLTGPAQTSVSSISDNSHAPGRQTFSLDAPLQERSGNHYHLKELLKYYDREFIENAYRAVLKREPDQSGLAQYLEHLRGGRFSRVDIIGRLRSSVEGREKNVHIEGLFWPAQIRRFYRLPFIGYLFELLIELCRLPLFIRSQRRFHAYSLARQERIVAHLNLLMEETHGYFQRLGEKIDRLAEIEEKRSLALREEMAARARELSAELEGRVRALDEKFGARADALYEKFEAGVRGVSEESKAEAARSSAASAAQFQATEALLQSRDELFRKETEGLAATTSQLRADAEQLRERAEQFSLRLQATRRELVSQERRSLLLLEEARRLSLASTGQPSQVVAEEERHFLDAFYTAFEDHFRGSREEIMKRLQVYLPIFSKAGITTDILDVGSGRGEWLEVLKSLGMEGRGIDTNRVQVEWCRKRGLEVANGDAIAYLRGLPDESLNAVTGFHIIEHLEFETLLSLLNEIVRVLRPGGLIIFETPNPENVSVASHNFYVDPTHRSPLPIPMMKFLLESRGLGTVEIIKLHPSETPRVEGGTDLAERFNEYFYGPMDYAIIGHRV